MNSKMNISFANVRKIAAFGVVCMLLFAVVSCESSKNPSDPYEEDDCSYIEQKDECDNVDCSCGEQEIPLKGTKWRLVDIVDKGTSAFRELAPKHCIKCYTLTFETSRIANVRNVESSWVLNLCDLPTSPVKFPDILICERYDGNYYCDSNDFFRVVRGTMFYSVTDEELRLFDCSCFRFYALFKRIDL